MAGGKTAAKKKKPSAADSPELRRVQAWVAEGLKARDLNDLLKHVDQACQELPQGVQLLGSLYLLLKKWPSGRDVSSQLQQFMQQLATKAANDHDATTALGQKPSIVLIWAAVQGLSKSAVAADGAIQEQLYERIVKLMQPSLKLIADPQRWLDQWQGPQDYPGPAEQDYPAQAKNPQQLAAVLSSEAVRSFALAGMKAGADKDVTKAIMALARSLDDLAAGKEPAKEEPKVKDKAGASKKDDKAAKEKEKTAAALAAQREPSGKQPQQQKRSKDTDKVRDAALRGTAGDETAMQELVAHRENVAKAQEKADKVLQYLSSSTLGAKSSQEHMAALQSKVVIKLDAFKTSASTVQKYAAQQQSGGKEVKKGDSKADGFEDKQVAAIKDLIRNQFGTTVTEQQLVQQLDAALQSGSWMVYSEGDEGVKPANNKGYFTNLEDFLAHVQKEYLDGKPALEDIKEFGMVCHDLGPGLLDVFKMDFGNKLEDKAAQALRRSKKAGSDQANGFHVGENAWMQAFSEDCPLRRYLLYASRTPQLVQEETVAVPGLSLDKIPFTSRAHIAGGFALLQLQRNQIVVAADDLSTAADWQVKAYHGLKLMLPSQCAQVVPENLDFVLFHYYSDAAAPGATDELAQMLDPDLYLNAQAAGGSAGQAGSSSSDLSFTDGLLPDTVTMLEMLHNAGALAEGALQLALQVYACKVAARPLPLPHKQNEGFKAAEVAAALEQFEHSELLELRAFLLQVLPAHFARLPRYLEFLDEVRDKRWRNRYMTLEEQRNPSGKERAFVLSREFYAQACMSAAMPHDENEHCCAKHVRMRRSAEAEGRPFSKYTVEEPDGYQCAPSDATSDEKSKAVQRYILDAARVSNAQQEKELRPGTEKGLQALTRELFLDSKYEEQVPPLPLSTVYNRGGWEVCRFYLLLASQLAIQREQLQQLILFHEGNLAGRMDATSARRAEKAVMQQRVAGMYFCYDTWTKWYEKTAGLLREELDSVSKGKGQGQDKAGKAGKETTRELQGKSKKDADTLHTEIEKVNTTVAHMEAHCRTLLKQVDMCAASADTMVKANTDARRAMQQTLELVVRELLNPRPAPEPLVAGRLRKALQLSRLTLFELDTTIMQYVNLAHTAVLANMWRHRQPAAAVSLARYALSNHLLEEMGKETMNQLLLEEMEESKTSKAATAAGKAAGKKKKKKGSAVQAKKVSLATSDQEGSDEEKEEPAAAAESEDEAAAGQNGEPDMSQLINLKYLQYEEDEAADFSSSSSSKRAAAGAAASAAAEAEGFKPVGRSGTAAAAATQQSSRAAPPPPPQQQQQRGKPAAVPSSQGVAAPNSSSSGRMGGFVHVHFDSHDPTKSFWIGPNGVDGKYAFQTRDGPVCSKCGHVGHVPSACDTAFCQQCGRHGHSAAQCGDACPDCGHVHCGSRCFVECRECKLFGHTSRNCPTVQCNGCGRFGHTRGGCPTCDTCGRVHRKDGSVVCCGRCKQQGHDRVACTAKQCPTCNKWGSGCVVGHCVSAEQAEAANRSSSRGPLPPPAAPTGSSRGPPSRPAAAPVPVPAQVALLSQQAVSELPPEREQELLNKLFDLGLDDLAMQLMENEGKRRELLRVPTDVMRAWLNDKDAGTHLQAMLAHLATASRAAEQPVARQATPQREQQNREAAEQQEQQGPTVLLADLPDAAAELFEAQFPPGTLPPDWRSWTWRSLAPKSSAYKREQFKAAKRKAIEAALAINSGSTPQQGLPEQQQQQWLRQPRLSGEQSGPRDSFTGDSESQADAEGAPVQMGPRSSSQHDAEARQQQQQQPQQHAGGTGAGIASGAAPPAGGVTAMQAMLQERLKKNQQQQVTNSYSMPQAQLQQQPQVQQQQQQEGRPVDPALAAAEERISRENLQPWMLHYMLGANRAIFELLPEGPEKHQLLTLLPSHSSSTHTNLDQLSQLVLNLLQGKRGAPDVNAWVHLGSLIKQAIELGPPAHLLQQQQQASAMPPAAAPGPMLPPHLRHAAGPRPSLPPHLQQHQPQQQQADEESGSDEDDDNTLLNLLGVEASAAAADVHPTDWAAVTGHQQEEEASAADFPRLGSQPVSAEEAEMERALAASRADQVPTAGRATVPGVSAAGLANQAGEYNCFLNVVVQCLWSVEAFTQQVRGIANQHGNQKHPVVEALLNLFERMEAAESGWQPGHERAVIDPTQLRLALAKHTRFKCQEMNDANELLDTIYECFAHSQSPGQLQGSRGVLIDGVFGLRLSEKVTCRVCGMETHKVPEHFEHLIVVNSTSLTMAAGMDAATGMDGLLRFLSDQEQKYCDKDEGGCGTANPRYRSLVMGPQVLTLQLVWDQQVTGDDIRGTLSQVEEVLDITRIYNEMDVGDTTFKLTSAVAYYGQHYMAFVFNTKLSTWLMFDDASVSAVGTWQDVINKCQAGRIQPGVLFYRLYDIASIPDEAAAPGHHQPAPAVVQHRPSSTASSSNHYGPGVGHHPGLHAAAAAAPSHAFAPAAAAAPGGGSVLPASSSWGARAAGGQRGAPQQQPAAAGAPGPDGGNAWSNPAQRSAAAAGFDEADIVGAVQPRAVDSGDSWTVETMGSQPSGDAWAAGAHSSGSYSSAAGPPGVGRLSSGGDGWAPGSPARPHATGPAAAGSFALAGSALRGLREQGPAGTGPRAANTGPVGMDRSGSGNAVGAPYGAGRGAARGRGPGRGQGFGDEGSDFSRPGGAGRAGGRGRGRG